MEILGFFGLLPFAVIGIILIALIAEESFSGASIATVLLLLWSIIWFGFTPVFSWIFANPTLLVGYICAYGVIGLISTFFLWDRYCARKAKYWRESLNADPLKRDDCMPLWFNNKSRLTAWFVWWPFSLANYIFGRMIGDFVDWVLKQFGNAYAYFARRHFN